MSCCVHLQFLGYFVRKKLCVWWLWSKYLFLMWLFTILTLTNGKKYLVGWERGTSFRNIFKEASFESPILARKALILWLSMANTIIINTVSIPSPFPRLLYQKSWIKHLNKRTYNEMQIKKTVVNIRKDPWLRNAGLIPFRFGYHYLNLSHMWIFQIVHIYIYITNHGCKTELLSITYHKVG